MANDTPIYEQIRAELRRLLASGAYKVGDQLPTTRELGIRFGTNGVQTIRSAYAALIDEGLVVARQGQGFFVNALPFRRLGLLGLAERAHEAREDAERAAGRVRSLEAELESALSDHERVAVDALTAAARATYLTGAGDERRLDFGEIALQVLAGAAANLGGVENLLAGRPGSWEADIIRNAVNAIAPEDLLPRYRTEPIRITLAVDDLLAERSRLHQVYDDAQDAIQRAYDEASRGLAVDDSKYVWWYEVGEDGALVPQDAAAPPGSWEPWRAGHQDTPEEEVRLLEETIREMGCFTTVYIAKSPELGAEYTRLLKEREAALEPFDLSEALEELQAEEWATYGAALKDQIERDAREIPGLDVPIEIEVDATIPGSPINRPALDDLAANLVENATATVPSPADLPETPLERLQEGTTHAHPRLGEGPYATPEYE